MSTPQFCTLTEGVSGFKHWVEHGAISSSVRIELSKANAILIPYEGFRDYPGFVFPIGTEELFHALRETAPPDLRVEIAVDDSEFHEVALHSELLIIAELLVNWIAAPVVVSLLADYISKRLGGRSTKAEVKASLVVEQSDGRSTRISYQGPAESFNTTVRQVIESLPVSQRNQKSPSPKQIADRKGKRKTTQ